MFLREQKSKLTNLRFLYSQDLSNCTTDGAEVDYEGGFCTLKI
ncbi:hypothetical protein SK667_1406 [Streptococcus mitis]|nr:hypothetical protein SK667_1406 [Streptococcus mitis]